MDVAVMIGFAFESLPPDARERGDAQCPDAVAGVGAASGQDWAA